MNKFNSSRSIFAWKNPVMCGNKLVSQPSVRDIFIDKITGRKYIVGFFFDFNKDFLVEVTPEVVTQIHSIFGANLLKMDAKQRKREEIIALREHIFESAPVFLFLDHKILNYHIEVQRSRSNTPEYIGVNSSDIFLTGLECVHVRRENIAKKLFDNCNLFLVSL